MTWKVAGPVVGPHCKDDELEKGAGVQLEVGEGLELGLGKISVFFKDRTP